MLTQVSVVPPAGAYWSQLNIPVQSRDGSGIFIETVEGLEPVQAEISTNAYNELDGEFYIGSRVGKRNVVLHAILEATPTQSVSELRRKLYGYFMPKLPVTLEFIFTDHDPVRIDGYAEDYQGDRFTDDPTAQVSIICPMPNFYKTEKLTVTGNSEVGTDPPYTDVLNDGDQSVGMTLRINNDSGVDFTGDIHIERAIESSPGVIYSFHKLWLLDVSLPSALLNYVWVNSKQGQKVVEVRGPDINDNDVRQQNLLGSRSDDSVWPQFYPATNKFRVVTTGTTGWSGNHLNWTLEIDDEFGGL